MKLQLHTWGTGERVVLLIHGLTDDHTTWWRVGSAIADRGYRVVAPDLRGHGISPRATTYMLADFADDLAESLPAEADVAIGNSLGGLALSGAVERLRPLRAIYLDIGWTPIPSTPTRFVPRTAEHTIRRHPAWSEADVQAEISSDARCDPEVMWQIAAEFNRGMEPPPLVAPSLVVAAGDGPMVPPARQNELRSLGFAVREVPRSGHVMHRDRYDDFMAALDGWI
ncbi:alpha/beta hydrolase [Nonomuraea sp. NPDC005983]|uniref:alpha/beta fold hydrolase n=1 Tax=Nonomuraea sp. NPDC005983 TaxID=3155595 RepID=UPI0033A0BD0D